MSNKIRIEEVYPAEPYEFGRLGSLGDAAGMLIAQYQFPHEYDFYKDKLMTADSDRCSQWDYDHAQSVCREFMGVPGDQGIGSWVRRTASTDRDHVRVFIEQMLKAKEHYPDIEWTGWRVLSTVHRGCGFAVFSLALFQNNSGVETYTGDQAPNVLIGPRNKCRKRREHVLSDNPVARNMSWN